MSSDAVSSSVIAAPEQVLVSRRVIDEKLIRECVVEDIEANETGYIHFALCVLDL